MNPTKHAPSLRKSGAMHDRYFLRDPILDDLVVPHWKKFIKRKNIHVARYEDPCAGDGRLTRHFGGLAYDLNPEPNKYGVVVVQRDYLKHTQPYERGLAMLMNVPYGKNSNTAIGFFNRAAECADYIFGVFPKTWGKQDNDPIKRLNPYFHLVDQLDLPTNSFYLPDKNNEVRDVPSVTQIWVRKSFKRVVERRRTESPLFTAVQNKSHSAKPDLAICRAGWGAGKVVTENYSDLTLQGWWFVYARVGIRRLRKYCKEVDWKSLGNGMSQRSINKSELIRAVENRAGLNNN
jgi:hypothetical protein